VSCFNFAIPGGMISDDYMIERALLLDETHRPKVIVLGLTLRDFLESHVPCAASTNSFKYFRHFFDIDDVVTLAMPEFWQRFDYWQSKLIYMIGERLDLQVAFDQSVTKICSLLLGSASPLKAAPAPEISSNVAHNLKTEAEPGDFVLHTGQIYPYEDNSVEYKKRFSHPSRKLFSTEVEFLKRLLAQAKSHNVKVLLVNMPLTAANMSLMPPGFYAEYLSTAKAQASLNDCPFLDLNDGKTFTVSDFRDTAHMNSSGGKKLLDAVVASIGTEPALAAILSEPAGRSRQLAGRVGSAAPRQAGPGAL
jgi:hypothetical protein